MSGDNVLTELHIGDVVYRVVRIVPTNDCLVLSRPFGLSEWTAVDDDAVCAEVYMRAMLHFAANCRGPA